MRKSHLIISILTVGFSNHGFAADEPVSTNAERGLSYSTGTESATLPEGVARVRLPYQTLNGNTTYDKDGNKSDSVATVNASGGAIVLEYGLSDSLSLQMKTDYRRNQTVKFTDQFRAATVDSAVAGNKSATYSSQLASLASSTGVTITDQASLETALKTAIIGGCVSNGTSAANCSAAYEGGTLQSTSLPATLTGSFGAGSSGVTAKQWVSTAGANTETKLVSGIRSVANTGLDDAEYNGHFSLSDTIVGVLYNPIKEEPLYIAVGGGLRLPTGNRNLGSMYEQDATRSAYEIGVRGNIDYLPIDWFMISVQNQTEVAIAGTKREVGGVSHEMSRKGARNVGFVYLKPSLHVFHPALDAVKTNFGITYDYDSAEFDKVNGTTTGGEHTAQVWKYIGIGYSFIHSMGLPLQFDVEYETPHSGKNVSIATTKLTSTIKAYAKF